VRPVNNAAGRVVFVLSLDGKALARVQWNRTGDAGVGFNAQQKVALIAELEEKALVLSARPVAGAEHGDNRSVADDFLVARAAGVQRANVCVIGLFGLSGAARGAEQREGQR
jgi:hypothetical protein